MTGLPIRRWKAVVALNLRRPRRLGLLAVVVVRRAGYRHLTS
jgi:hypothetical protein